MLGDTYFCCYLGVGEKRCDTIFCRIRLYITFMLAIVQSKSFFYTVLVWRDGHGVQRIFSPLAPYQLDEGWRSIERAGRSLDGFWHAFGCTYLLVRSSVSHRTKHTNYYKSSNLHIIAFSASVHNPHTPLSSHQHTSSPHMHIHHPSSTFPSPSTPSPANITRPTP